MTLSVIDWRSQLASESEPGCNLSGGSNPASYPIKGTVCRLEVISGLVLRPKLTLGYCFIVARLSQS